MLTLKSSAHIRTARYLKSFRSCGTNTGWPMRFAEVQRGRQEEMRLAQRERRRAWLTERWEEHLGRCRRVRIRHRVQWAWEERRSPERPKPSGEPA